MIDLSKLRAPGWQRVVGELSSPAGDDRTFLARLLVVLGQVSAARQAVLMQMEPGPDGAEAEPRAALMWPPGVGEGDVAVVKDEERVERLGDARSAARAAAVSKQTRVFGLEGDDAMYGAEQQQGYVVAAPVPAPGGSDGTIRHVVTLLLDSRSRQALQTTLALVEVLAGYTHGHAAVRALQQMRANSAALELATRLIASINQTRGFKGATLQLVNDVMRQLGVDRVALGWVRGVGGDSGDVRVRAISDTENVDRRMEMVRKIESAMDECFDQEQAVLYPQPPTEGEDADVLLSQAIAHEHRTLAAADAKLRVASVPLRDGEEVVGVLTLESTRDDAPLDVRVVEWLQAAMDLVTPVLSVRRSDDRMLATRAWASAMRGGSWLVGPKHTAWKLAGVGVMLLLLAVVFVRVPYNIEAPVELRPQTQRVLSAPFNGVIDRLGEGIRKGVAVGEGQELVRLRTTELELTMQQALTQMLQAQTRADAALREGRGAEAEQALAEVEAARAQVELYRYRIEQAVLRSPIDGFIVDGDLEGRVGSTVNLGDPLFVVARLDDLVAIAKVDDRDISYVEAGMGGALARKSRPNERLPIVVERIVPMALPEDGANRFEVRTTLDTERLGDEQVRAIVGSLRPGMEGVAKLNTGRRTIAWVLSRRIRDTLRIWLWW